MRARIIAAAALATWSKTALAVPAMGSAAGADDPHPPVAVTTEPWIPAPQCTAPASYGPGRFETTSTPMIVSTLFAKTPTDTCPPGVLTLQASHDGVHWKDLSSAHTSGPDGAVVVYTQHTCLAGTWSYRNAYVADDLSYKNTAPAVQFTC